MNLVMLLGYYYWYPHFKLIRCLRTVEAEPTGQILYQKSDQQSTWGKILIWNSFAACEIIQGLMWAGVNWLFPNVFVQSSFNINFWILKPWTVKKKRILTRIFTSVGLSEAKRSLAILWTPLPTQNTEAGFRHLNSAPNHHTSAGWVL